MYMMNNYSSGGDDQQYRDGDLRQYWVNNDVRDNMMTMMSSGGGSRAGNNRSSSSKPIRRRSRVSKKTPITLLNTDATNFRSLVQQFTGCPNPLITTSTSFQTPPLDGNRGPLNLNFQLGTVQNSQHHNQATSYQRTIISGDQSLSSMVNDHDGATAGGDTTDEITRTGGHNHMEMVQELLMLDDGQEDLGLFRSSATVL